MFHATRRHTPVGLRQRRPAGRADDDGVHRGDRRGGDDALVHAVTVVVDDRLEDVDDALLRMGQLVGVEADGEARRRWCGDDGSDSGRGDVDESAVLDVDDERVVGARGGDDERDAELVEGRGSVLCVVHRDEHQGRCFIVSDFIFNFLLRFISFHSPLLSFLSYYSIISSRLIT